MMTDLNTPLKDILQDPEVLVSVIVPSYNKGLYLPESVASAAHQTYKNIEIVIVNDGSTDSTTEVARSLERTFTNRKFQILEKANGGISDARNFAIARCSGRVVCCLDGDDIAEPTFVEKGLVAMRNFGANLVCCDVVLFGAETGAWEPQPYEPYAERYNNNIPTLVMYDKALWAQAGGYSVAFPFNEDWEFFLRLSRNNLVVHKIPEKLFRYRVTESGLAQNFIKDSWDQSVGLMITSNNELYPVEHVIAAHRNLSAMRESWKERFAKQLELYPEQWLLYFWIGLYFEGKNLKQDALGYYIRANEASRNSSWQPLYRIAALTEGENRIQSAQLLHAVRLMRPDMNRLVEEHIKLFTTANS